MVHYDDFDESKTAHAHSVLLRLALAPYTVHFKSPTYMQPATLDLLDKKVCRTVIKSTAHNALVRQAIGADSVFWAELFLLLHAATPSLEKRSFTVCDASGVDYDSTSGALIASNYPALWRDLERLTDLIAIGRNVLAIGSAAQDRAAQQGIDFEIFRLINCCVRVAVRGFDGDAGTGEEEKWQWVVNAYKKVLITSLQFVNNLVAQNETRKSSLWVALFDTVPGNLHALDDADPQHPLPSLAPPVTLKPIPPITPYDIVLAYGTNGESHISPQEFDAALSIYPKDGFKPLPPEAEAAKAKLEPNGWVYFVHATADSCVQDFYNVHKRNPTLAEIHRNISWYWHKRDVEWSYMQSMYEEAVLTYSDQVANYEKLVQGDNQTGIQPPPRPTSEPERRKRESEVPVQQQAEMVEQKIQCIEAQLAERNRIESEHGTSLESPTRNVDGSYDPVDETNPRPMTIGDMRMLFTAEAGTKILESGKLELMKRLEDHDGIATLPPSRHPDGVTTRSVLMVNGNPIERTRSMSQSPHRYVSTSLPATDAVRRGGHNEVDGTMAPESPAEDGDELLDHEGGESEEVEDEEDEDEEDYPGSAEDGRGLFTDIPLVLGPTEIEVLPMLVMSGIAPYISSLSASYPDQGSLNAHQNAHTVRTHLLLSQTPGRNLLRELLIFVAAWDLREDELYFKFMVKIMEAILKNGLMPYAYHAFRDRSRSKDIISPAQAVIMKLLTCIFRGRSEAYKQAAAASMAPTRQPAPQTEPTLPLLLARQSPDKVDLHILNFIFTEFRQHIIPQTCALIFLQGQIHKGRASPEDFPLNLWDMERMYEGVYQYLEFFAVLTEEVGAAVAAQGGTVEPGSYGAKPGEMREDAFSWKKILATWEMTSELVTLLRELEDGIPKMGLHMGPTTAQPNSNTGTPAPPTRRASPKQSTQNMTTAKSQQRSLSADAAMGASAPIAVERPFDVVSADAALPPLPRQPSRTATQQQIFEAETPLAYPEDPVLVAGTSLTAHDLQHGQDEPSDFEWRNLKKLTVLVLSSLIWKNKVVQDQVRQYGGLEALLRCCLPDKHNPYIREHAIMCLRFAIEGNEENKKVIQKFAELQASVAQPNKGKGQAKQQRQQRPEILGDKPIIKDVPREVLDPQAYETFMDAKGQVGLRRKAAGASAVPSTVQAPAPSTVKDPAPSSVQAPAPSRGSAPGPSSSPAATPEFWAGINFADIHLPRSAAPSAVTTAAGAIPASSLSASGVGATLPGITPSLATSAKSRPSVSTIVNHFKSTAEKAAELVQNALGDLPAGDKTVTDRQKAEALARLDRAFETTEKALGRARTVIGSGSSSGGGNGSGNGNGENRDR